MVKISKGLIVLVIVIGCFIVLDAILITGIISASSKLSECKNNENVNCPNIMCNGDPNNNYETPNRSTSPKAPDGTNSAMCWPYAYREVLDKDGNLLSYQCNFPFPGTVPLIKES